MESLKSRLQHQVVPTPSIRPWHPLPDTSCSFCLQMGVVDEELFALEAMVRSENIVLLDAELNLGQGCKKGVR